MFEYGTTLAASVNSDAQQIASNLRQGNVLFLQQLVGQYQYRLVRYFIYLMGRRDGVDDLVQETWLRVLERGSSYDGRSRFEPWLFTIAANYLYHGFWSFTGDERTNHFNSVMTNAAIIGGFLLVIAVS